MLSCAAQRKASIGNMQRFVKKLQKLVVQFWSDRSRVFFSIYSNDRAFKTCLRGPRLVQLCWRGFESLLQSKVEGKNASSAIWQQLQDLSARIWNVEKNLSLQSLFICKVTSVDFNELVPAAFWSETFEMHRTDFIWTISRENYFQPELLKQFKSSLVLSSN